MFETKRKLKQDLDNAELRALTHFRKLYKIENIIKMADLNKEMYCQTIEKIKEVIVD